MAQTLTRLLVHLVFSTKAREDLITIDVEPDLFAYIGGICRGHGCTLLAAGGTANHVHLLVSMSKTLALSDLLLEIKRDSSHWIKTKGATFAGFHWQDGYGAFTIGESQIDALTQYIRNQREHHRTRTFEDEYRTLLRRYRVEFDERYLWA